MEKEYTAGEIIERFSLEPLIPEGGWFSRFRYVPGEISAIYYMLRKEDFSEFHILPYPEQYFFLMGDPVEIYTGAADSGKIEKRVLGRDLEKGEVLTHLVNPGVVQGLRLAEGGRWGLVTTVMNPPYEPEIYRTCPPDELLRDFPDYKELIKTLTK